MARIDAIQRHGHAGGVPTGLIDFDRDHGGLFPGELIILAARPGCGKSSLALQIAKHNGERGRLVYFASLEMSKEELSLRMACGDAGVSNRLVRNGTLEREASHKLAEALAEQGNMNIDIHDEAGLSVAAIRREIRRRKKRGLTLAVIDYLQLITPDDSRVVREQQVATITRDLKNTARKYAIPILCLCQLNRQVDEYEIPKLSHLRESGAIEQDSDVVMFLSRHRQNDSEPHNATWTVAKNRNGETGSLRMEWDGPRTRFSCAPIGDPDFY
jgi:replicative DNA helicase